MGYGEHMRDRLTKAGRYEASVPTGRQRKMGPGQPFEFAWPMAIEHRWITAKPFDAPTGNRKSRYLVRVGNARMKLYKPLEMATGLFREFSRVEPALGAIQTFATTYGMLG